MKQDSQLDERMLAAQASQLTRAAPLAPVVATKPTTAAEWLRRFDSLYQDAGALETASCCVQQAANPALLAWLDGDGRERVRPGARVAVAGCGLGYDAAALFERGYDVIGLDASAGAIAGARGRHTAVDTSLFRQADLLALPSNLLHRFDVVIDSQTLQSLPEPHWQAMAQGMAGLLRRHGLLVSICRNQPEAAALNGDAAGPPFAISRQQLFAVMAAAGLQPANGAAAASRAGANYLLETFTPAATA